MKHSSHFRHSATGRSGTIWFVGFLLLFVVISLGGGGSRDDVQSLLYVRSAAIIFIGLALALKGTNALSNIVVPLYFSLALAGLAAVQLVPMPSEWWTALPSREVIARSASVAGLEQPWRPISLTPAPTLNALVSLFVPLAALIGIGLLDGRDRRRVLFVLLAIIVVSGVLGVLQVASGSSDALYLYRVTNVGSGVGLFANRNHEAIFLSLGFPLLFLLRLRRDRHRSTIEWMAFAGVGLFLLLSIWTTGSRAGLIISILVILASYLAFRSRFRFGQEFSRHRRVMSVAAAAGVAGLVGLAVVTKRMVSLDRLFDTSPADELRVILFDDFWSMAFAYWPTGSGFGSFPHVFRIFERPETLMPNYVNHAHMDWLEIVIEGGLPAMLLLVAFLGWWCVSAWRICAGADVRAEAKVAVIGTGALLIGSLADYPLRTPLLASVFVILCAVMHFAAPERRQASGVEVSATRPSE